MLYVQSMDTQVSIWERELADPLDAIIRRGQASGKDRQDNYDLVMAQIPGLFGDSEKATYLGFRALGLRPTQAMELLGLNLNVLELWREETPELDHFEYERLPELQSKISADIIRLQFLRNMTLFLFQDSRIVSKSLNQFDSMSPREFNYLRSIRRFYSNHDLLNLNKALEPEKHRSNTLVLSFGSNMFEVSEDEYGNTLREVEVVDQDKD